MQFTGCGEQKSYGIAWREHTSGFAGSPHYRFDVREAGYAALFAPIGPTKITLGAAVRGPAGDVGLLAAVFGVSGVFCGVSGGGASAFCETKVRLYGADYQWVRVPLQELSV